MLRRLEPPQPLIARRHLFHTGTLRYFDVRFIEGEELERVRDSWKADDVVRAGADGAILFVLPSSGDAREKLRKRLTEQPFLDKEEGAAPAVLALPSSTEYLGDLARELAALERVQSATPALQSDVIARKELASRLSELEQLLEQEVARVFSADNPDCAWYTGTGPLTVRSSRELMETLSALFDERYGQAPSIRNELLNRRELSSAAAKA